MFGQGYQPRKCMQMKLNSTNCAYFLFLYRAPKNTTKFRTGPWKCVRSMCLHVFLNGWHMPPHPGPIRPHVDVWYVNAWTTQQKRTHTEEQPIVQKNMFSNDSGQFATHRKQNLALTLSFIAFSEFQDRGAIFRKGVLMGHGPARANFGHFWATFWRQK